MRKIKQPDKTQACPSANTIIKQVAKVGVKIILLLFACSVQLSAKTGELYVLDGYMGVQGGESFHYQLILRDSIGDIMTGYSYSYKQDKTQSVKAYVIAKLDRKTNSLHIKEQRIIYNNGFKTKATVCLVNALLIRDQKAGNLSGTLITQTFDNEQTCSTGSLSFIQEDQINKIFGLHKQIETKDKNTISEPGTFSIPGDPNNKLHQYFEEKEKADARRKELKKEDNQEETTKLTAQDKTPEKRVKKITQGDDGIYVWHSNEIIFEIWDGSEIDNDRVTVAFNGSDVLTNYSLTAQKEKIIFELGNNAINIITITAKNEGANPPNTANITIWDGTKAYNILAHNTTGKTATIRIKKEK